MYHQAIPAAITAEIERKKPSIMMSIQACISTNKKKLNVVSSDSLDHMLQMPKVGVARKITKMILKGSATYTENTNR